MGPGEALLDFDSGRDADTGQQVTCFASTEALWVLYPGGTTLHLPYVDVRELYAAPDHVAVATRAGRRFDYRFRRPRPGFTVALREHASGALREQAERWRAEGRLFEVSFASGAAARFTLADDGTISAQQLGEWSDSASETMLFEQAYGELEASLGRTPELQHADPRPAWMGDFTWSPALPSPGQR
jgi:hypothetical protein